MRCDVSLAEDVFNNPQTDREAAAVMAWKFWRDEAMRRTPDKDLKLNNFYWDQVVGKFADFRGYVGKEALQSIHELWKKLYLPRWAHGSTRSMSKGDMVRYIEHCIQHAAEEGLVIYWPSELRTLEAF